MTERFWNKKEVVSNATPILTTLLLEGANIGQIAHMWTVKSALGQSLISWLLVFVALLLWWNFYRVNKLSMAKWAVTAGLTLNAGVWLSILYFRYVYA